MTLLTTATDLLHIVGNLSGLHRPVAPITGGQNWLVKALHSNRLPASQALGITPQPTFDNEPSQRAISSLRACSAKEHARIVVFVLPQDCAAMDAEAISQQLSTHVRKIVTMHRTNTLRGMYRFSIVFPSLPILHKACEAPQSVSSCARRHHACHAMRLTNTAPTRRQRAWVTGRPARSARARPAVSILTLPPPTLASSVAVSQQPAPAVRPGWCGCAEDVPQVGAAEALRTSEWN